MSCACWSTSNVTLQFKNLSCLKIYRLQELKAELSESRQSRSQLEQVTFTLTEELRTLRGRLETQHAEFSTALSEVRNKARKLEDENRLHVSIK